MEATAKGIMEGLEEVHQEQMNKLDEMDTTQLKTINLVIEL